MKLGPVTKLNKRKKRHQKNRRWRHVGNCDVIIIFPICSQFAAMRKPDFTPTTSKQIPKKPTQIKIWAHFFNVMFIVVLLYSCCIVEFLYVYYCILVRLSVSNTLLCHFAHVLFNVQGLMISMWKFRKI